MARGLRLAFLAALAFLPLVACDAPSALPDAAVTASEAGAADGLDAPADAVAPAADAGPSALDAGLSDTLCAPDASGLDAAPVGPRPSGYGALLDPGGATFRVWAPGADAAEVVGTFGRVAMARGSATADADASGAAPEDAFEAYVPGVRAGDTYHFELTRAGATLVRVDPYCRELAGAECRVLAPRTPAPFIAASREESVVYELHVGSFAVEPGASQGTFASVQGHLDELADLGVNVLELMPVQDFGGRANGWGYNPQLYFAPKPSYGSAAELSSLVAAAHQRGIGVWLDVVYNHADGWSQAPMRCFDGDCPNGAAGIYFFPPGPYASTPWGPRPDYTRPRVAGLILDSLDWWLSEVGGDGFRVDSVSNIRGLDGQGTTPGGKDLLVRANELVHRRGALSVAEDLKGWDQITTPSSRGGFGFDAQWDGFGWTLMDLLASPSDDARDLGRVAGALQGTYAGDPFARVIWVEDHDTVGNGGARLPSRINPGDPESWASRKRSVLGGLLVLTAPGVPMIFQGQERLATGTFANPPAPLAPATANGARVQAFYRDMIRLRRNLDGGTGSLSDPGIEIVHRNDNGKVIAYRRHGPSGEDVLVVVNLKNHRYPRYDLGVRDAGAYRVRLDTDWTDYGADFGGGQRGVLTAAATPYDGRPYKLTVALGAYSAVLLSR